MYASTASVVVSLALPGCKRHHAEASGPAAVEKFGTRLTVPSGMDVSKKAAQVAGKLLQILLGGAAGTDSAGWTLDSPDSMLGIAHGEGGGAPKFSQQNVVSTWPSGDNSMRLSRSEVSSDAHLSTSLSEFTNGKLTAHVKAFGGKNGEAWDVWIVECASVDDGFCQPVLDSFEMVDESPYLAL